MSYLQSIIRITGLALTVFSLFFAENSQAAEELPPGYQYVFPGPDAKYVYPQSTIIIRFGNISPLELSTPENLVKVFGEESGNHPGQTTIAADSQTLIFKPHSSFESGETVKVTVDPGLCGIKENTLKPLIY
jgi:hypothetical protein